MIYGLKRIAQDGLGLAARGSPSSRAWRLGVVFVRRQRRLADPLIDLRLFRMPAFSASLAMYTLGTFVAFGAFVFVAQYLQLVLGLSPLRAGLWMLPFVRCIHRRVDAGARDRAARSSGVRDGRRPGPGGDRLRHVHPSRAAAPGWRWS